MQGCQALTSNLCPGGGPEAELAEGPEDAVAGVWDPGAGGRWGLGVSHWLPFQHLTANPPPRPARRP